MADQSDLIKSDACAVVNRLRQGDVTPHRPARRARSPHRQGRWPGQRACRRCASTRARAHADRLMRQPPGERGLLAGLPVPIKDLTDVAGVRTTQGSPIFADHVPERSDILVERLEANGGIVYAKSNTPEFGAGANTFNEVFGATRNPWNTVALGGGLVRRRRGGARDRHGLARARHRHGRLAAQPGELLRHRRHAAEHRPGRAYAGRQDRSHARRAGPDGAQRRGPCAAARRHERRASGRSAVAAGAADIVPVSGALKGFTAAAGRLFGDPRHHAGRSGGRRASPGPPPKRLAGIGVAVEEAHPDLSDAHDASRFCAPTTSPSARRRCCASIATCSSRK